LIEQDTAAAIAFLRRSLERVPWGTSGFTPLLDAAPQRLLLASLLLSRGETSEARRWLASFGRVGAVGDGVYVPVVERLSPPH
jgi:hypothetical protein